MTPNAAERLHSFLLHDYNYYKHLRASVVEKPARVTFQMKDVVTFDYLTVSDLDIFLQPHLH